MDAITPGTRRRRDLLRVRIERDVMPEQPVQTILFQPPNRVGLGHLSRLIAIALAVKEARPDVRVPFVVGGNDHGLLEAHGLPFFCLPDRHALLSPGWESWSTKDRHTLVLDLACTMIKLLQPDMIVFDCFPHGAMAHAVFRQEIPTAICLRAMKDMSNHYEEIRRFGSRVKAILIPHAEGECDVPEDLMSRTCFTGPITRPLPARPAQDPAQGDSRLVVISGGGGGYPQTVAFYNLALEALRRARGMVPDIEGLLVTGPLFNDWWQLRLVDGVRVMPFDPHLSTTLARADLVVCQAGYNTIAELRALGVPTLCVPAIRESDDQFKRASEAESGSLRTYTGSDPETLARSMAEILSAGILPPASPHVAPLAAPAASAPCGATIAADTLLRLLEQPSRATPSRTEALP